MHHRDVGTLHLHRRFHAANRFRFAEQEASWPEAQAEAGQQAARPFARWCPHGRWHQHAAPCRPRPGQQAAAPSAPRARNCSGVGSPDASRSASRSCPGRARACARRAGTHPPHDVPKQVIVATGHTTRVDHPARRPSRECLAITCVGFVRPKRAPHLVSRASALRTRRAGTHEPHDAPIAGATLNFSAHAEWSPPAGPLQTQRIVAIPSLVSFRQTGSSPRVPAERALAREEPGPTMSPDVP